MGSTNSEAFITARRSTRGDDPRSHSEIIEEQPWSIYGYAMRQQIVNGEKTEHFAIEVVSKVEKIEDGQYVLKFNILFNNGERHLSKYVGNVRQGDEFTKTTLTQDLTMETPGFGYLEYRGPSPMWNIKGVNRWSIRLYTDGIVVHPDQYWGVELNGEGEYITIELFTDSHYTTEIPEGRYVISKEEVPYHANMGQGGWGYNFGTWYYDLGDNQAPAVSGEVNVGRNGDDYTVAFQLIDDRGNTIQSDYAGPPAVLGQLQHFQRSSRPCLVVRSFHELRGSQSSESHERSRTT
ncbi:MAG: hypothetical protein ACLTTP_09365 [Alistipes ihumii]